MLPEPRFCPQCGGALEKRMLEGREGLVCAACHTPLYYRNPLPVAAAVVLNERREVLLVQRKGEPHQGAWCLPMGFAEAGGTITQAAVRELKAATGIEGRLVRLLDTDSCSSDYYGDLLFVTFEIEKTGGTERPGAAAAAVGYFPLSRHPTLAFSSNERALRVCGETHLEEWLIQDSFERLEGDESKVMLSDVLVAIIKDGSEEIARRWLADLRTNPTTAAYQAIGSEALVGRTSEVLSQFGRWLKGRDAARDVRDFYFSVGQERKAQGFKAHEVLSALMLLKKHIWSFIHDHAVWERPIDVYRALELSRRIAAFFDKAMYHTTRGFEERVSGTARGARER